MTIRNFLKALLMGMLIIPVTASAVEKTVVVSSVEGNLSNWGTEKKEVYSVAMQINKPELAGKSIIAIRMPVLEADYYLSPCVWVAKTLDVADNLPVADIKAAATYTSVEEADGSTSIYMGADLPEPYLIPDEGVYIGCSFEIPKLEPERPASITPVFIGETATAGSFWFQGSRSQRQWKDMYEQLRGQGCALQAVVLGDFITSSVEILSMADVPVAYGNQYTIPVTIEWGGSETLRTYDYELEQNGVKTTGTQAWTDAPSILVYGASYEIPLDLTAPNEPAELDTRLTITAINGTEIEPTSGTCRVSVVPYFPRRQSVMEEYTGLTCAWCVRGIAAVQRMEKLYGDKFVAIAIHNNDPMATIETGDYPNFVSFFPYSYINRTYGADPYFGTEQNTFGIDKVWDRATQDFTPWELEMKLHRGDVSQDVCVEVSATCVRNLAEHGYRISVMLTGDGLTDHAWKQSNGVSGRTSEYGGDTEELDYFVNADSKLYDWEFNDVALMYSSLQGDENSIPQQVNMLEPVTYSYTFETSTELLVKKAQKLHVVALITDEQNRVSNCLKGAVPAEDSTETYEYASIGGIAASAAQPIATQWYDLQGRPISQPSRGGLYILHTIHADGTVKAEKIIY